MISRKKNLIIFCILIAKVASSIAAITPFDTVNNKLSKTIELAWDLSNLNPDSALAIADNGLLVAKYFDLKKETAELLRVKGVIQFYKVDYVGAFNLFTQCRDLNIEIGNKAGEAAALNNISLIYRQQGFIEKTLEMDLKILEMRRALGDSARIAQSLNNLAVTLRDMKKTDEALHNYRNAIEICLAIHNESSLPMYYNNVGSIFLNLNQLDSAYFYFQKSLVLGKKQNNKQMVSNSLAYLGDYHIRKHEYNKAIDVLEPSLALAKEIGIVYEIESAAEFLHVAYAGAGRYRDAYNMHLLYKVMGDSADNVETMQKITEVEASLKFEEEKQLQQLITEKKEMENALVLNKEKQIRNIALLIVFATLILLYTLFRNYRRKSILNGKLIAHTEEIMAQKEEIESQRDEIELLNNTKDKFFTIIAHDLKNPVNGVYRLSEIMDKNFDSIEPEKLKQYISQIHFSTKKNFELLENLLRWATVQTSAIKINPAKFDLTAIINQNIELLNENAQQKQLHISCLVKNECLAYADAEMINTVVRNLLNNAIKFSSEKGLVEFNIVDDGYFLIFSIKDTGIGMSEDDMQLLFNLNNSTRAIGSSKEKGTGLGLVLCKEFVELNCGEIWVESEPEKGSTFYFTVHAARKKNMVGETVDA